MLVYRVETDKGVGPYRMWDYWVDSSCRTEEKHPCPSLDKRLMSLEGSWDENNYFGFSTVPALMRWFHLDERIKMKEWKGNNEKDGSVIGVSVYRIPRKFVTFGAKQVGFYRDKATLIERRDILNPAFILE